MSGDTNIPFFTTQISPPAINKIKKCPNNFYELFGEKLYLIGLKENEFTLLVLSILSLTYIEGFHRKQSILSLLNKQPIFFRWSVYISIGVFITIFGVYGSEISSEFIYFQF